MLIAIAAPRTGHVIHRLGTPRTQAIGMAAFLVAYVLFARVGPDLTYPVGMLLLGVGFASAYPATTIAATDDVADEHRGVAATLVNSSFQLGGALALAGAAATVAASLGHDVDRLELLHAIRPAVPALAAVSTVGLGLVGIAVGIRGDGRRA